MSKAPRGGLGVRHRQAEAIEKATRYRLTGVKPGSRVAECLDKYGRWEGGHRLGYIMRNSVTSVSVQWDGDEDFTYYAAGEARYRVDRNLWRITPPAVGSVFSVLSQKIDSTALTGGHPPASIMPSPHSGDSVTEEDGMTPKKHGKSKGKKGKEAPTPEVEPQADELAEDDDAEESAAEEPTTQDGPVARDTYTAKQVATRIGTDSKTLRKFFRSSASTVEAVGQGGRYEFDAADLPKIKSEFDTWKSGSKARGTKTAGTSTRSKGKQAPAGVVVVEEDDELLELDEEDPTAEDLEELEDEELDDEDLSLD